MSWVFLHANGRGKFWRDTLLLVAAVVASAYLVSHVFTQATKQAAANALIKRWTAFLLADLKEADDRFEADAAERKRQRDLRHTEQQKPRECETAVQRALCRSLDAAWTIASAFDPEDDQPYQPRSEYRIVDE